MKPARNPRFLAWIRTLPCLVCGRTMGIEAAHTGAHGLGQKSSDMSAIPLCRRHHRTGPDSYHKLGARAFERYHRLGLHAVAEHLSSKPSIRVESGLFIGCYLGEEYMLGPVQAGLDSAVHQMLIIKRQDRTWCSSADIFEPNIREFLRNRERFRIEF